MKINLPQFVETDLGKVVVKLRDMVQTLERSFARIRPDDAIIIGGGQPITRHYSATTTWNPANLAAGAQTTTTVTVENAALGDEVTCSFSLSLQGMQLTGYVSAADTVTVVLRNGTAGAIDLGSGTLRASVWRH